MNYEISNANDVRSYLLKQYHVKGDQVDAALQEQESIEAIRTGINFRSHYDYVGDQIAKHMGWEWNDDYDLDAERAAEEDYYED